MSYVSTTLTKSTDAQSLDETIIPNVSSKKIWEEIINKNNEDFATVNKYILEKENKDNITPENSYLKYLNDNIFPSLLQILEKTLCKAIRMECITNQKSLFNGLDYISERLWINNPKFPERQNGYQNIFLLDWVQEWLKDHPRLIFPKSWIWTKEEAAVIIQAYMRGHFIRKIDEVQDMRQFWKILLQEKLEELQKEEYDEDEECE